MQLCQSYGLADYPCDTCGELNDVASNLIQRTAVRAGGGQRLATPDPGEISGYVADCTAELKDLPVADNKDELQEVHVVYGSDEENFPSLLTSMISLGRNQQDPSAVSIHIVVKEDVLRAAAELVQCYETEMGSPRPKVELHRLLETAIDYDGDGSLRERYQSEFGDVLKLHNESFVRCYLPSYFPGLSRVIWLDTDVIVQGDLTSYYQMNMSHAIAASADIHSWGLMQQVLGHNDDFMMADYDPFNDGVMLVDLKKWHDEGISAKLEERIRVKPETQQAVINSVIDGSYDKVGWSYNFLTADAQPLCSVSASDFCMPDSCVQKAKIVHMSGAVKIWHSNWLEVKGHMVDYLYKPYTPKTACSALQVMP